MTNDLKCDFCYKPETRDHLWTFPATDFTIHVLETGNTLTFTDADVAGSILMMNSTGGWAACEDCAKLVTANDQKGLRQRVVDNPNFDDAIMQEGAMFIIESYFLHATGPGVPPK